MVKDESGEIYVFKLRRYKCENCQKIHTEIPDCIMPYKQYSKKVISDVCSGKCDYYVVDNATVWRWKSKNTPNLQ